MSLRHLWLAVLFCLGGLVAAAGEAPAPSDADIEKLAKALGAEDFDVREKATAELLRIGERARAALERAETGGDLETRTRAGLILRELRWKLPPELAARIGKELADRFAACANAAVEERLIVLSGLRARAPAEAERYILQTLQETGAESEAGGELVSMLTIYRSRQAEDAVLAATRSRNAFCRAAAAGALASFPEQRSEERLVAMMADGEANVRMATLEALASRGRTAKGASAKVIAALGDADDNVRSAATRAAGRIGAAAAAEKLWPLATADAETDERTSAIGAVAELSSPGDREAALRLVKLLDDRFPAVRSEALRALVAMRGREAAGRLAELIDDRDPSFAAEVVWALGVLGGREQLPALRRRAEKGGGGELAAAAARAMIELGDERGAGLAAKALAGDDQPAATVALRALAMTGDIKWAKALAEAPKRWPGEEFKALSLEARDRWLRDPEAVVPFGELLAASASEEEWASFLAEHALFAQAAEVLQKAFAEHLDNPGARSALGTRMVEAGKCKEGLTHLREAAAMEPFGAGVLNNLAWFLLIAPDAASRDPAEGLRIAARAAEIEPRNAAILDTHAWALFLNGKKEEALDRVKEALLWARDEAGPEKGVLEVHRARILVALDRRKEAKDILAFALKLRARDPRVAAEAARAYCELGRSAGALAQLGRMVDLGYPDAESLAGDPDLALARQAAGFKDLVERAAAARAKLKAALPERAGQAGYLPRIVIERAAE